MAHPPFFNSKQVAYIKKVSSDKVSFEFVVTQHLRMSGVYWGLTAMSLLGKDLRTEMLTDEIVDWVMTCQDSSGGFGGNTGHDPHMLYTLSALQILILCDELHRLDKEKVAQFIASLQNPDGSFMGDHWGEIDTRFSYCALSALSILGVLRSGIINVDKAVEYIARCKNFDGGFGAVPGAESHAGQIFCCVGALSIAEALHVVDEDLLGWWLSERQCDSGGLNGRPEKQADVCYSWWILSSLSILGRIAWIDKEKLVGFILECQDKDDGGIADRPGNMADIFHTFFGISGLSLLHYFSQKAEEQVHIPPPPPTAVVSAPIVGNAVGQTVTVGSPPLVGVISEEGISSLTAGGDKGGADLYSAGSVAMAAGSESAAIEALPDAFIDFASFRLVDPTYALPVDIVARLGLPRQSLPIV